ncbi:MAG: 3-dehydroquinate synthase [Candidatus Omnitrophica bacterium]|nr:3-dehydroquinate synthase [Candidatus Omnitrophota bacterium]
MRKINLRLGSRSYPIYIGHDIIDRIADFVKPPLLKRPILIVTNKKINALIGRKLAKRLLSITASVHTEVVPDSERAKSFGVYNRIIAHLSKIGRKEIPLIIALGGGVVGDVAGFAASTYRRGIPYIQLPTTLLAQVDSSIGGKVAVDIPQAKNMVGSFYQPRTVISDTKVLKTLPDREIRNGMAEIIKYGVIRDASLFKYLEKNLKGIMGLKRACIETVISKCARIKAAVVEKDEFDVKGERAILNFGHTFGHAIEASFKYSKKYTHGEAVSIGMVLASEMSLKLGLINKSEVIRIKRLLKRAHLPLKAKRINFKKVLYALNFDKKFSGGTNRFVLPRKIGQVGLVEDVPEFLIETVLSESLYPQNMLF